MAVKCTVTTHFKIYSLLLFCLAVYLYLYANAAGHTKHISTGGLENISLVNDTRFNGTIPLLRNTSFQNESFIIFKPQNIQDNANLSERANSFVYHRVALLDAIVQNKSKKLLTLFTTWIAKPSKYTVYHNTVNNWARIKPFARLVIFTNETEVASYCSSHGWEVLPVTASSIGVPILKKMFLDIIGKFDSYFYAFSNGDILYTDSLIDTLLFLLGASNPNNRPLLVVGKRTNVKNVSREEAMTFENITSVAKRRGKLFLVYAEDYFITTETYPWKDIPPVVIGRPAYDNWLVFNAIKNGHVTIDATGTVLAVHQTTKTGDYEGHSNSNSDFNPNLLAKLYKRINYNAGGTSCCTFMTEYDDSHIPKLIKRDKIPKYCFPI